MLAMVRNNQDSTALGPRERSLGPIPQKLEIEKKLGMNCAREVNSHHHFVRTNMAWLQGWAEGAGSIGSALLELSRKLTMSLTCHFQSPKQNALLVYPWKKQTQGAVYWWVARAPPVEAAWRRSTDALGWAVWAHLGLAPFAPCPSLPCSPASQAHGEFAARHHNNKTHVAIDHIARTLHEALLKNPTSPQALSD